MKAWADCTDGDEEGVGPESQGCLAVFGDTGSNSLLMGYLFHSCSLQFIILIAARVVFKNVNQIMCTISPGFPLLWE